MAIISPSAVLAVLEYTNIQLVEYLKLNPSLPIKLLLVYIIYLYSDDVEYIRYAVYGSYVMCSAVSLIACTARIIFEIINTTLSRFLLKKSRRGKVCLHRMEKRWWRHPTDHG